MILLATSFYKKTNKNGPVTSRSARYSSRKDNARPHLVQTILSLVEAALSDGFNIRIRCEPLNSPDLSIFDLGLFASIQATKEKSYAKTIDELVAVTERAFEQTKPEVINLCFLTLQGFMKSIILADGCHNYALPHMCKESMERRGILPSSIECEANVIEHGISFLEK